MPEPAPERGASHTAILAARQRAHHHSFASEPRILVDPISERLLGPEADLRRPSLHAASVVLRSRYCEDRLQLSLARGVTQLVILGAGLDTFAYRQPPWAQTLRIFEVDHYASQADKRRRLARGGVPIPDNLEFVAIDFDRMSLRDGLLQSAVDFSRPTFFSCLGVMGYLTRAAVDAIFGLVAEFPPGGEMVFEFSAGPRPPEVMALGERLGEPYLSWLDPEALPGEVRAMGLEFVRFTPEEAQALYFENRSDGLTAPQWPALGRVSRLPS